MTTLQTAYEELICPTECRSEERLSPRREPVRRGSASPSLFDRVVVPLGLAADAEPLLRLAAESAARFHGEILLLQLMPASGATLQATRLRDSLSRNAQRLLRAGAARVQIAQLEGNAGRNLEDIARRHQATLILLSEERDDFHPPHWFGTVTQRLARSGNASLLVAKPGCALTLTPLLCAVDFSESSRVALGQALELARALVCRLTILHVVPVPVCLQEEIPVWRRDRGLLPRPRHECPPVSCVQAVEVERKIVEARGELASFVGEFASSGVQCEMVTACGSLVAETISAARARKAGLIVIGSAPRCALTAAESQSPAATMAEIADIPVLISQLSASHLPSKAQISPFAHKTR
jgi:nucleotide-binding universal stress UspA family protein